MPKTTSGPRPGTCENRALTTRKSSPNSGYPKAPSHFGSGTSPARRASGTRECRKRSAEGVRRYWESERPIREAEREAARAAAADQIGQLSDREIIIAGAIAYWCEGAKKKPT